MKLTHLVWLFAVACMSACSDAGGLIIVEYEDVDIDAGIDCGADVPMVDAAQACAEKDGVCP